MGILDKFTSKKERELKGEDVSEPTDKFVAAETSAKAERPSKRAKTIPAELSGVIIRPLVTEKAAVIAQGSQYSFVVAPQATRVAVRSAIKAAYGVIPTSVNIQRVRGKVVRFGRTNGQRSDWKKAIVTLPKGKKIDVYEGV